MRSGMFLLTIVMFCFAAAAAENDSLPTVVVVTTGGTIAEKFDPVTGGASTCAIGQ